MFLWGKHTHTAFYECLFVFLVNFWEALQQKHNIMSMRENDINNVQQQHQHFFMIHFLITQMVPSTYTNLPIQIVRSLFIVLNLHVNGSKKKEFDESWYTHCDFILIHIADEHCLFKMTISMANLSRVYLIILSDTYACFVLALTCWGILRNI